MNRLNDKRIKISFVCFLVMVAVNTLGAFGYINAMSQREVSHKYDTIITPAGFTFSIWGVIYTLLFLMLVVAWSNQKKPYYKQLIEKTSTLFWVSCALNVLWNIVFLYEMMVLSFVVIVALFVSLFLILQQLKRIHQKGALLPILAFGIYTGWLFIASFVNFAAVLIWAKFDYFGLGEMNFSAILVILAIVCSGWLVWRLRNAVFSLPIAWAFWGGFRELQPVSSAGYLPTLLLAGMVAMLLLSVLRFYKNDFDVA